MSSNLLLNGRYRLLERIAAGGMGEVWSASDEVLGREVAVKLLKNQFVADDQFRARFRAEAQYAARLSHPGIAQVYDFGEQDDLAFLVMELVRGEPLSAILERAGRLTPEVTLDLVSQAARALQTAHDAGIVHRDIKPGNLMITSDGRVKITDFGIARAAQSNTLTQTGMVMGTAQYVSPEQASGKTVTAASDIYSLGVVAYECLAGTAPFTAEQPIAIALAHVRDTPDELPEDIPQPVADLVMQALSKDPQTRPMPATRMADSAFALLDSPDAGFSTPGRGFAGTGAYAAATSVNTGPSTNVQPPVGMDPTGDMADVGEEPPRRSRKRLIAALSLGAAVIALGAVLTATMWPTNSAKYSGDTPRVQTSDSGSSNGPAATEDPNQPTPTSHHTYSQGPQTTSEPTRHTMRPTPTQTSTGGTLPTRSSGPRPTHSRPTQPTHPSSPPDTHTTPPATSSP
ncbi:MAG TPA: protein kinase [Streptosporangiaceae bacterium]|jgi:serine/threonine-protein kinase